MENITAGEALAKPDMASITPDKLGKYSPLLFKWLNHKHQKTWCRPTPNVFQAQVETLEGRDGWLDHWRPRDLIIGRGEFLADGTPVGIGGRRLADIICGIRGALTQGFSYGPGFGLRDITAEFWAEYERIGRCAWDHDHGMSMTGDESRWHYIAGGRQRECQWCGRVFEAEVAIEPVIAFKERTTWSEYRSSVPATLLHPMGSMGEAV